MNYDESISPIREFQGQWRFLSNFWWSKVVLDGVEYPTVEHAYQAAKTSDPEQRKKVAALASPYDAKKIGRFVGQRSDWTNDARIATMEDLVRQKFSHPHLRDLLLTTGAAKLEEGNRWGDTFWGKYRGRGENHLGRIIMRVRVEIVNGSK